MQHLLGQRGNEFKVIIQTEGEKPQNKEIFIRSHKKLARELTPCLVYLNYEPISASFGVKKSTT